MLPEILPAISGRIAFAAAISAVPDGIPFIFSCGNIFTEERDMKHLASIFAASALVLAAVSIAVTHAQATCTEVCTTTTDCIVVVCKTPSEEGCNPRPRSCWNGGCSKSLFFPTHKQQCRKVCHIVCK